MAQVRNEGLASQGMWNGWHLSTIFCIWSIGFFILMAYCACNSLSGDPRALILGGEPFPFQQCWFVQMAFSTALFLNFICWLWTVDKDKARLFYLVVVINGIPVLSYGLLASGFSPILIDVHGRRLIILRYIQWLFTTPAMIYLYSLLSSVPTRRVVISMANGAFVIIAGYLSNVLPAPFDVATCAAAFLAFYEVMQTLNQTIALAVAECGNKEDESYCGALKSAKMLTTFSWVGIPAVWTLAYCDAISHSSEEVLYESFDFIIKSGVSCIIMHSSLKTYTEKKEERMRAELAEERGTIKALRETARMKVGRPTLSLLCVGLSAPSAPSPTRRARRRTSLRPCRTSCARLSSASSVSPTASWRAGPRPTSATACLDFARFFVAREIDLTAWR